MGSKQEEQLKDRIRNKYARISRQKTGLDENTCCDSEDGKGVDYSIFSEDYSGLKGHVRDADFGLGCGLPTEFARIRPGDTVVDLGSGAGNDCFIARQLTGEDGLVIGLDMTADMIAVARRNADKLGYENIRFIEGEIENIPLEDNMADVVVSNCVFNLVPDKAGAFAETYRILKPGGHFSISDVVVKGGLPEALRKDAEMYAGCVAGAMEINEYLDIIHKNGFTSVKRQKEKPIILPDEILERYPVPGGHSAITREPAGIFSITVYAEKPL